MSVYDEEFLLYDIGSDAVMSALCGGRMKSEVRRKLLAFAEYYGLKGNLLELYALDFLISSENPFSLACERREVVGDIEKFARKDLDKLEKILSANAFNEFCDYKSASAPNHKGKLLMKMAENFGKTSLYELIKELYRKYGVGKFAFYSFFTLSENGDVRAVETPDDVKKDDLIGYEIQKKELFDNTLAFVSDRGGNNVLLYGDNGTGKSTMIRAAVNEFSDRGLRLIEMDKSLAPLLPALLAGLKRRNYRFVIYMDDLSFESDEREYKYLKAVIDGGVEVRPKNVLIYATSNRRHLIRENYSDRNDEDDKRRSDTVEEKLSLSNRFGLNIRFGKPSRDEYHEIVCALAKRYDLPIKTEELIKRADIWEMEHGGLSGRTAAQFIRDIMSR